MPCLTVLMLKNPLQAVAGQRPPIRNAELFISLHRVLFPVDRPSPRDRHHRSAGIHCAAVIPMKRKRGSPSRPNDPTWPMRYALLCGLLLLIEPAKLGLTCRGFAVENGLAHARQIE